MIWSNQVDKETSLHNQTAFCECRQTSRRFVKPTPSCPHSPTSHGDIVPLFAPNHRSTILKHQACLWSITKTLAENMTPPSILLCAVRRRKSLTWCQTRKAWGRRKRSAHKILGDESTQCNDCSRFRSCPPQPFIGWDTATCLSFVTFILDIASWIER